MKLIYGEMGHILRFDGGYVNELVIENRKMFFDMVSSIIQQADGGRGDCVLSISDKPVEFSRHPDVTVQFAPFQLNRKNLITKLCASLEQKALLAENFEKTQELLGNIERYVFYLADEFPFEVNCQKLSIAHIVKAVSPEIDDADKSGIEKIFAYMELVRELDRDRLFVMVNMRPYFSDDDMESFVESACLHDFKVLLVESNAFQMLQHTKRYVVDSDLCEF